MLFLMTPLTSLRLPFLSTLLRAARAGVGQAAGLVLLSPWVDLTDASLSAPSMHAHQRSDYLPLHLIKAFKDVYIHGEHGDTANDASDPLISPAHAQLAEIAAALPRTLITFGTGEALLDQQRAFVTKLQQARVQLDVYEQIGMPHVAPMFAAVAYGPTEPQYKIGGGGGTAASHTAGSAPLLDDQGLPKQPQPPVEALNRIERFVASIWGNQRQSGRRTGYDLV